MARVFEIQFPDISKLRDGTVFVKTPTFAMSHALSRVSSLVGAPVALELHRSLNSSKGTVYSIDLDILLMGLQSPMYTIFCTVGVVPL